MTIDTEKDTSFEQFEQFIKTFYLQSLKELREMNEQHDEYDASNADDLEGVMLNTQENVMTNATMVIEAIAKSEIDDVLKRRFAHSNKKSYNTVMNDENTQQTHRHQLHISRLTRQLAQARSSVF